MPESYTYCLNLHKDHLGSWTTVTTEAGEVIREQSFDAWGNLRNPDTWSGTVTQQPMFDRGFTGHEHVQYFGNFGLINMNGRMYDPVMSSFLSVDNYVQCPDFSQNFNRYAYCLNNPLKYTDPSGESVTLLAAVAIGAAVSMVSTATMNFIYDRPLYEGLGRAAIVGALQGAFSFGIGAAAGVVNTAVTSATSSTWGTVAQVGFQTLAHGTLGGLASEIRNKGSFWQGFASGAAASLISGAVGGVCGPQHLNIPVVWAKTAMIAAGGLGGGVSSLIAGGEFVEGLCNGLICAGLNHALHHVAGGMTGPDDPPSPEEMKERVKNLVKAQLSLKLSFSSKALFDEKSGYWMGKNGKFYSMKWGGNKYTGGKYKFAQKTANVLKGIGYAMSVYQGGTALYDYAQGDISSLGLAGELGFNVITTVTGDIGAAVSVGRALSGVIINTEWYQDFKFNVNYGIMEHKIGTPNESNQLRWMDFINNYK